MPDTYDPKKEATEMALEVLNLGKQVQDAEAELMQVERFKKFIELQQEFKSRSEMVWAAVEALMIENDIKSIKGDWGSLTIAERIDFDIDYEVLPKKFYKKTADTTKIRDTFKLEGRPPKGTTPRYSKNLTKRFKKEQ